MTWEAHILYRMDIPERQAHKISTISDLDELDGYEAQAKLRGLMIEEILPLKRRRDDLTKTTTRRRG